MSDGFHGVVIEDGTLRVLRVVTVHQESDLELQANAPNEIVLDTSPVRYASADEIEVVLVDGDYTVRMKV